MYVHNQRFPPIFSKVRARLNPSFETNNARLRRRGVVGFSLVEVALAVAIIAVAYTGILALLPNGLNIFRQAMDATVSSQIIQRVLNEAKETDFNALIAGSTGTTNETILAINSLDPSKGTVRWFDDQANELSSPNDAIYHVITRIMPATALPKTGTATSDNANLATVTVQVANNPVNRPLAFESGGASDQNKPMRNLWNGAYQSNPSSKVVPVLTASAVISRNQ
jgi:uncharacterized protein (TIGR02598 family)